VIGEAVLEVPVDLGTLNSVLCCECRELGLMVEGRPVLDYIQRVDLRSVEGLERCIEVLHVLSSPNGRHVQPELPGSGVEPLKLGGQVGVGWFGIQHAEMPDIGKHCLKNVDPLAEL